MAFEFVSSAVLVDSLACRALCAEIGFIVMSDKIRLMSCRAEMRRAVLIWLTLASSAVFCCKLSGCAVCSVKCSS